MCLKPGVLWGLAGTIHPLMVAIPELLVKLWKSIEDRNLEEAVRLQGKVIDFTLMVMGMRQYGRSPLRDSLQMRDLPVKSFPRWPTKDLSAEDRKKLEATLKAAMEG
ncbi:MAG: dihydrodipicolinate synthase family protein [Candidatus Binatia bacterium]|nr:dihydrodipicolinate synthase family protein [Candidatus Binatia bacterium]